MAVLEEIILFVGVFLASAGFNFWWKYRPRTTSNDPPTLPSLPLIGSLLYIRKGLSNISEFFLKTSEQLGPMFIFMAGSRRILVLNSKDIIEDAYIKHLSTFAGRKDSYINTLVNPNKKGLIHRRTNDGWKRLHHLCLSILKEFGFGIRSRMEERILAEVEAMIDYLKTQNGQVFNPRNAVAMVATNVINCIVFGHRREYEKGLGELYIQMDRLSQSSDFTFQITSTIRFLPRFKNKISLYKEAQTIIANIIKREIERCKMSGTEDCFVKRYLEKEGIGLDQEQLQWTIRDLIAAGSDTTITTLLWSLVALANHPDAQERLREEMDGIIPRSRLPTLNDQRDLPFAEATVLEVMRWKTLVPLSLPRITLKDANLNGYFIKSETMVLANLYAAHMDPKTWIDPNEFRPERFLDNDNKVSGRNRIIPFSLGRRSCLGEVLARAEIFLVVTAIVQNFKILPPEGQEKVNAKPLEPIGVTMIPLPFDIRLIPRP